MILSFTRQDIKNILMDPKAVGVKEPYFQILGESGQNITLISPGKNGEEYNKTAVFYHTTLEAGVLAVAYGQGLLLLQRNGEDAEAKEFRVVTLRPGITVEIPVGYYYSLVNVGKNFLVVVDNFFSKKETLGIEPIVAKHGLVYYLIERKGEVSFEVNPNYKLHPQITTY